MLFQLFIQCHSFRIQHIIFPFIEELLYHSALSSEVTAIWSYPLNFCTAVVSAQFRTSSLDEYDDMRSVWQFHATLYSRNRWLLSTGKSDTPHVVPFYSCCSCFLPKVVRAFFRMWRRSALIWVCFEYVAKRSRRPMRYCVHYFLALKASFGHCSIRSHLTTWQLSWCSFLRVTIFANRLAGHAGAGKRDPVRHLVVGFRGRQFAFYWRYWRRWQKSADERQGSSFFTILKYSLRFPVSHSVDEDSPSLQFQLQFLLLIKSLPHLAGPF